MKAIRLFFLKVYISIDMISSRALLIGLILLIVPALGVPSQTAPTNVEDDLYYIALKASIIQMEKQWGHLGHSALDDELRTPTDYRRMIVYKNPVITEGFPTVFENHFIDCLDDQELIERYKKGKKPFAVLKISPIHNRGAILNVVVSVYWFSYESGRMEFAYSDWSDVSFKFNSKEERFIIESVKLGGI